MFAVRVAPLATRRPCRPASLPRPARPGLPAGQPPSSRPVAARPTDDDDEDDDDDDLPLLIPADDPTAALLDAGNDAGPPPPPPPGRVIRDLPIFPLNLVAFPGADGPLHLFEARYRVLFTTLLDGADE